MNEFMLEFSGVPITSAARGDDLKCRPFRKMVLGLAEKMSTNSRPLCRPPSACAAPNFQLFCPFLHKVLPFSRKCDHFYVNLTIFQKMPPLRKCRPGRLAPSAPLGTPLLESDHMRTF